MSIDPWRGVLFRCRAALSGQRLALLFAVSFALSIEILFQPDVFEAFAPAQIARAIGELFVRNLCVGATLFAAIGLAARVTVSRPWRQSVRLVLAVFAGSAVSNVGLAAALYGFDSAAWLPFSAGETLRWTIIGSFLVLVDEHRRRRLHAATQAREALAAQAALQAQTELAQVQLLEAQIEPHFLFNTIANLRRTWRIDAALGERMHANVLCYLRSALPQWRQPVASLADEVALVRAYLELFAMRMGARLRFAIDVPDSLARESFPRMMLITLAENAIKHGLMPSDHGGEITVDARAEAGDLVVRVRDNGVGFGAANTGGTGVGLANIRARLITQYGSRARLAVDSPESGGVCASIRVPLAGASRVGSTALQSGACEPLVGSPGVVHDYHAA